MYRNASTGTCYGFAALDNTNGPSIHEPARECCTTYVMIRYQDLYCGLLALLPAVPLAPEEISNVNTPCVVTFDSPDIYTLSNIIFHVATNVNIVTHTGVIYNIHKPQEVGQYVCHSVHDAWCTMYICSCMRFDRDSWGCQWQRLHAKLQFFKKTLPKLLVILSFDQDPAGNVSCVQPWYSCRM
jgi:hypothetical protein